MDGSILPQSSPPPKSDFYWYYGFVVGICNFSVDDGGKWKFPEKQVNSAVINLAWFCHLSIVVLLHSIHNQKKERWSCMEYSVQSKKTLWDRKNELTERGNVFSSNVERGLMTAYSIGLILK